MSFTVCCHHFAAPQLDELRRRLAFRALIALYAIDICSHSQLGATGSHLRVDKTRPHILCDSRRRLRLLSPCSKPPGLIFIKFTLWSESLS